LLKGEGPRSGGRILKRGVTKYRMKGKSILQRALAWCAAYIPAAATQNRRAICPMVQPPRPASPSTPPLEGNGVGFAINKNLPLAIMMKGGVGLIFIYSPAQGFQRDIYPFGGILKGRALEQRPWLQRSDQNQRRQFIALAGGVVLHGFL
jgi:hypothetical protein